ncbi:ubiquinol-cytochrome c reductase iron-sulfur subunit [Halomarina halobia]|uniref:Ubiquinol-cytochrome c reductase iron-sulfur subunit n=1 Tax=Halomarina halobia TaxID=3033386 RepID=A0ABD6ACX4_9EURY|nr:ubiquinol-cytochrome c reductase iron-sulfur subunit [Halomarina sp. PSR21]
MADDDKYPTETGRRRFVKGVVGAGVLAGVGTGAAAALGTATAPTGSGGGITEFVGIENTDGPAPRGMPVIPVQIADNGDIQGLWPEVKTVEEAGQSFEVAETDLGGVTYSSEWFQYCGVQTYAGIQPSADQENTFLSAADSPYEWQSEELSEGDPLNVSHFEDYENFDTGVGSPGLGKPAMATWRSQDVDAAETIPVQVVRSDEVIKMRQEGGPLGEFIKAATTEDGFMAWLDKCTHFCCVPAFKAYEDSAKFGAADEVYCQCHQSVYAPFTWVQKSFVALPRPEGEDGGGGGGGGNES